MCAGKMHADEVETDVSLVRRLLTAQFPQWADLRIEPVASAGTDNAIYRLGEVMAVRLPRVAWAIGQVEKEHRWLPKLAPHLPLAIPVPIAKGRPATGTRGIGWSRRAYYLNTNPVIVNNARHAIDEVLADHERGA